MSRECKPNGLIKQTSDIAAVLNLLAPFALVRHDKWVSITMITAAYLMNYFLLSVFCFVLFCLTPFQMRSFD